jgi:hypothetical protein
MGHKNKREHLVHGTVRDFLREDFKTEFPQSALIMTDVVTLKFLIDLTPGWLSAQAHHTPHSVVRTPYMPTVSHTVNSGADARCSMQRRKDTRSLVGQEGQLNPKPASPYNSCPGDLVPTVPFAAMKTRIVGVANQDRQSPS